MQSGTHCRLLNDSSSRQEIKAGQQVGLAQDREYLSWLRRLALRRALHFLLLVARPYCRGLLVPKFILFFLVILAVHIGPIASHHLRQFGFTANIRKLFDTIRFSVLHEV